MWRFSHFWLAFLLVLIPVSVLAQFDLGNIQLCPVDDISCLTGASQGDTYLRNLITGGGGFKLIFFGVLAGMLIYYGIKLLLGSHNENTITETRQAYLQALSGAVVVGGAFFLADAFATEGDLIVESPFDQTVGNLVYFLRALVATAVVSNVVFQGIRLIIAQEDSQIDQARKRLIHGTTGAAIAILAYSFVEVFFGINIGEANTQIAGIGQYIATILGAVGVLGVVIAGIMLVISVDESLKDRAKTIIISSIVALVISITAYSIVTVFL